MELRERISMIVKASGLSQEAFAKEAGVKQSIVSAWCLGQRVPSYRNLVKLQELAQKFKVKVTLL